MSSLTLCFSTTEVNAMKIWLDEGALQVEQREILKFKDVAKKIKDFSSRKKG
jgi:hypothetical protein